MHRLLDQRGINSVHIIPPKEAQYAPFPPGVAKAVVRSLADQGIGQLYAHQAQAIGHIMEGRNVIITTGTSSGKSLVYTIPMFSELISHPQARALYITPTKALGQNQMKTMQDIAVTLEWPQGVPVMATCDGDTPFNQRRDVINSTGVLITTPDFIHAFLLPRHLDWPGFWGSLKYIVIDEAHTLKGVMGCHCLQVFRRLRRVCDYYGARPVFILCTATIANPGEFATKLVGLDFAVVTVETSASGEKTVVFYEPPTYKTDDGRTKRRLTHFEAARAVGRYVESGRRTIMFGRSRRIVESAYRVIRENFPGVAGAITPYKGTYVPQMRRDIEKKLFNGNLKGVISTNALELGINVGELDTCILAGFAGSISSTWQQAGRVGRKGQKSLIVLMANEDPLDLYIVRHPQYFFGQPFEKAVVSEKMQFLVDHLPLAAKELPLSKEDAAYWDRDTYYEAVKLLLKHRRLKPLTDQPRTYGPAGQLEFFSLRGESDNYSTISPQGHRLEEYNYDDVIRDAYPGAILPVYNRVYLVENVDHGAKSIQLRDLPAQFKDFITRPNIQSRIAVEKVERTHREGNVVVSSGVLNIHKSLVSYNLINVWDKQKESQKTIEVGQKLKPIDFPTVGIWLDIDLQGLDQEVKYGAAHALKHLLQIIIPLEVMCERHDLGASLQVHGDQAQIFIYDNYAGGVGLAESVFEEIKIVLERCYELVTGCRCLEGCPSCIIIPQCLQANERLDKEGVTQLLAALLGREVTRKRSGLSLIKEKLFRRSSSRADIKMEARALEIELKEYEKVFAFVGANWLAVADLIKQHYPARLIKYEITILAVHSLIHSQTGKPVPERVLKQAVSRCCGWSDMYRLSLQGLKEKGYLIGPPERLTLFPDVQNKLQSIPQMVD
ncbi:DEAD/DEAH box helicase [Desulfoscipio gibsoniae]|uniref:Helicase family protein with metal-binding cysteine cluster n=1 Tax=Desulfoscipio gibsoniae DSM 7213 TaxID=767817 RepID=R4KL96_9FIRM|nr:DEAD/DEAH box helicase [Desulfoscipio gibsoniae]AGL00411.1 helicase family protein with metal-binding cysteine cluster [Desulfoscipio gibsoniae DSM 7213]